MTELSIRRSQVNAAKRALGLEEHKVQSIVIFPSHVSVESIYFNGYGGAVIAGGYPVTIHERVRIIEDEC